MNIFIIIIEQGYLSVKFKKAYDWLEQDDEDSDQNFGPAPEEINLGSGNQKAYEKEMFIKLRDAFEGITDGNKYGMGTPIDNHPIPKGVKSRSSSIQTKNSPANALKRRSFKSKFSSLCLILLNNFF